MCQRSTAFRAMITTAAAEAATVVMVRFTSSPISAPVAGEQDQRDQGERDAEGQHHLREHQRRSGVDAEGEHHERRGQGQSAAGSSGIRRCTKPCITTWPA